MKRAAAILAMGALISVSACEAEGEPEIATEGVGEREEVALEPAEGITEGGIVEEEAEVGVAEEVEAEGVGEVAEGE